jgi:sugar/nucleoside kinase (ribokinase family)
VVCGDVINDILVKPLDGVVHGSDTISVISARPGGSAANQAAWMAHLGLDVVFAGRCGARDAGYHRGELERFGVRTRLAADPVAETGSIVIMVSPDGERTMFTDRGANLGLTRADVPAGLLDGAAALHLTGYTFFAEPLRAVALSLIADARVRGLPVTMDPGSAAFLAMLAEGEFLSWTSGAAVCFPNVDEAAILTGAEPDPVVMAKRLTKYYGIVVLKLGAGGCVLAVPGEEPVQVAAAPVAARDTTGAGDAFCAAFLSRWLAGREPGMARLADAAEFAVRIAASAVTVLGGRPRLLDSGGPPVRPAAVRVSCGAA